MTDPKKLTFFALLLALACGISAPLYARTPGAGWRVATPSELKAFLPPRAPVGNERIETEMRTASGITNGKGKFVAGVVLIVAGYSAEGKYSHYFLSQVPLSIGQFVLPPGQYAIGWHRQADTLNVSFYEAASGKLAGTVEATRQPSSRIASFRMTPPGDDPRILIGRFGFKYRIAPD